MNNNNQASLKKNIIYDKTLLCEARESERKAQEDPYCRYTKYHKDLEDWYHNVENFLDEIVMGKGEANVEELSDYLFKTTLTTRQIEDLFGLRMNPIYKRVLGLAAINKLEVIEDYLYEKLGEEIEIFLSNRGQSFNYYGKKVVAVKTSEEIGIEVEELAHLIYSLRNEGKITQKECQEFQRVLFDVYEYYTSISEGEQLSFPKLSDREYVELEKSAKLKKTTVEKRLFEVIQEKKLEFSAIQNMQQEYYEDVKRKIK